jgi:ADP-ribose pyrophosphatase
MQPEIIKKHIVTKTKFLDLVQTTYKNKLGNESTWISANRPNNQNAVVIVALVHDENKEPCLVVIKEFRVPIEGYEYGLPAGLIEPNQSVEATAIKELLEETGLNVSTFIRPISPAVFNSPGITNEAISYAFVYAEGRIDNSKTEESEDITAYLMTRKEVQSLLIQAEHDPKILLGAKAWLIFNRFVEHGDV